MPYERVDWALRDTQLQYYLHISNPNELPDYEWATKIATLQLIRTIEKANSTKNFEAFGL